MIDKVFMRILMVLGMIFLITLINFTYNYKTYDVIRDNYTTTKIHNQTGDAWYYRVREDKWIPMGQEQTQNLNQNEKPNKD